MKRLLLSFVVLALMASTSLVACKKSDNAGHKQEGGSSGSSEGGHH